MIKPPANNDPKLPRWFILTKKIATELFIGFATALCALQFWLRTLMRPDMFDLAVSIIIPFFLTTLILSCSNAIEALKKVKSNGN